MLIIDSNNPKIPIFHKKVKHWSILVQNPKDELPTPM